MSPKTYRVTVLIRTRDIERHFQRLLHELSSQTLPPSEIVVVDNFSSKAKLNEMTDLLLEARSGLYNNSMRVKIVPITDVEFSYAYSVNVGIFVAECDLVCITNGHCLPISEEWLESAVAHFAREDVAGVGGYTLPDRYGTAWEKMAYDWSWRRLKELSRSYVRDKYFSTVNCILRRSSWEEYPFDEKMLQEIPSSERFGGEDYDWGLEMLSRGHKILVEPRFDVYHSHGETISQLVPKYLAWRKIRRTIRSFRRPRKSYTRLEKAKPLYFVL